MKYFQQKYPVEFKLFISKGNLLKYTDTEDICKNGCINFIYVLMSCVDYCPKLLSQLESNRK